MQTNNTFATTRLLDDCGLDPNSSFFKQLQDLLRTNSVPINSTIPLITVLTPPTLPILNLQDVIAASKSHPETERSPSPIPEVPEPATGSSDLFRELYAPSGKWKWMSGHNILDEESKFLSGKSSYFCHISSPIDLQCSWRYVLNVLQERKGSWPAAQLHLQIVS